MKTKQSKLKAFCTFLLSTSIFTACYENGEDIIYDFSPVVFQVYLHDEAGHDLLDSLSNYSISLDDVRVNMYEKCYPIVPKDTIVWSFSADDGQVSITRAYLPVPFVPYLTKDQSGYSIIIGEFAGDGNGSCTIQWNDKQTDELSYTTQIKYHSNGTLKNITRKSYLNDKQTLKTDSNILRYNIIAQ